MEEHKSIIQTIPRDKKKIIKAPDHHKNGSLPLPLPSKRKRSSPMQLLRAALYVLRFRSRKSKSKSSVQFLKGLVGSMRPMHLHSVSQIQSLAPATAMVDDDDDDDIINSSIPVGGNIDETKLPSSTLSPAADMSPSPVFYRSTYGSMSDLSQYDSPLNLHRVQSCDDIIIAQRQEECWFDDEGGDEMIDAKAEEFIARFYQRMRLDDQNN